MGNQKELKAEEYLKREWCDPIWGKFHQRDVIDIMEEYSREKVGETLKEIVEDLEENGLSYHLRGVIDSIKSKIK